MFYEPSYEYTFYDIIPYSDVLICDYSSIYFDFILTQREVVFNFYDYEKYCNNRGLSYDPIESIVKGAICYDEKSFLENLEKVFKGNKAFKHSIADKLFNKHFDKLSSERITKELRKILS